MESITIKELIRHRLLDLPSSLWIKRPTEADVQRYKGKGGIYIFYQGRKTLYVGIANDLNKRITHHITGHNRGNKLLYKEIIEGPPFSLEVFEEENRAYRELYESYLILTKKPTLNKKKTPKPYTLPANSGGGRPRVAKEPVAEALGMYDTGQYTVAEITRETGISRATFYRNLKQRIKNTIQ